MKSMLSNTTILVVDDDIDTCHLLRSALEQHGASVATAHSVDEALDAFRHCPPHAIVSDMRLGNSDGYELIQAVREFNAEYRGFTPVVAMTGFASPDDEKRALAAGFNAYISKPVDPREIVRVVDGALSGPLDLAA
jgi:CheY-like chemotaxis protein